MDKQDSNPIKFDCKVGMNMDIQVKTNPQGANEAAKILASGGRCFLILIGIAAVICAIGYAFVK